MQPIKETQAILNLDIETIPKELEMCERRPDVSFSIKRWCHLEIAQNPECLVFPSPEYVNKLQGVS